MDKEWYTAIIITRSASTASDYRPLYQESMVLLQAASQEEADEGAKWWADNNTPSYANSLGEQIEWKLVRVLEVKKTDDPPGHFVEIHTRFFRDYEAYRRFEPLLDGEIE